MSFLAIKSVDSNELQIQEGRFKCITRIDYLEKEMLRYVVVRDVGDFAWDL